MPGTRCLPVGVLVLLGAALACDDAHDPAAPEPAPTHHGVGPPTFSVVDPGAEVNPTISVTEISCGGTGTVTVSLQGIEPPAGDVPLDLMLVLDESGSIDSSEWDQIRQAALGLLDDLDAADGTADQALQNVRVGVIRFSGTHVQLGNIPARYDLPLTGDYLQVRTFLLGMDRRGGATDITAALDLAEEKLVDDGVAGAARAVLFMTDGVANQGDFSDAGQLAAAQAIKDLPARLFVVGVGTSGSVDTPLLTQMASADSYVGLADFAALEDAFQNIATQVLVFPAATDLTFSADVPAGFSLVTGSSLASKGTVTELAAGVSWTIDVLEDETVTLTYQIQHDDVAAPLGGLLPAVVGAQLTLTTPISEAPHSEALADTDANVVDCDVTPPVITDDIDGSLGDNGWYVDDVTVSFSVDEPESPATLVTTGCETQTVDTDTPGTSFTCEASSLGGDAAPVTVTIMRDATPPDIGYAGALPHYDAADAVAISCDASDALSTLASDTCADISGPAWSFDLGGNTFTAEAIDVAGNEAMASVTFVVGASFDGLCTLAEEFVEHASTASSLCGKVRTAQRAAQRGNDNAMRGALNAFINQVNAQDGKKIPSELAQVLRELATALMM